MSSISMPKKIITSAKEGYVFFIVCSLATLRKNFWMDLHEIFREGWHFTSV